MTKTFASDNSASVHPLIMEAILCANEGHAVAYGEDPETKTAIEKFREHFGRQAEVAFVYNGTGANVVGLKAMTHSYHSILCSEMAHINTDECNAPERFTGCKLVPIPTSDAKLTVPLIEPHLHGFGIEHHAQPGVIAITQTTELGTVYTPREIADLAELAHAHKMWLHMDGARIANAAVSLGVNLREITTDVGVDMLSFGGTKNGVMFGEAVVCLNPQLAAPLKYYRKQAMQLHSKMRFIAAQFNALLTDDLWRRNAEHANRLARRLAEGVAAIPGVEILQPVQANALFVRIPAEAIPVLQEWYFFYVWDESGSEVRWMVAFDTDESDVESFLVLLQQTLADL